MEGLLKKKYIQNSVITVLNVKLQEAVQKAVIPNEVKEPQHEVQAQRS